MSIIYSDIIEPKSKKHYPSGKYFIVNQSPFQFAEIVGGVNSTMKFELGELSSAIIDESTGFSVFNNTEQPIHFTAKMINQDNTESAPLANKVICLDAGHGGKDPGAVNGSHSEKHTALEIVLKLARMLSDAGANVILTRDGDTYPSLSSRAEFANKENADLFISVHLNSAENKSATGFEVLVYKTTGNAANLGNLIINNLKQAVKWPNRGLKARPELTVLQKTSMPAVLVEVGFISNDAESKEMQTYDCQIKLANAMYNGILSYYA